MVFRVVEFNRDAQGIFDNNGQLTVIGKINGNNNRFQIDFTRTEINAIIKNENGDMVRSISWKLEWPKIRDFFTGGQIYAQLHYNEYVDGCIGAEYYDNVGVIHTWSLEMMY